MKENDYNIKIALHTFLLVAHKDICKKLMAKINLKNKMTKMIFYKR